jgi:hypothetical protein
MRKFILALLVTAVSTAGMPLGAMARSEEFVTVKGTAYTTTLQPLSGANLQIRNLDTGVKVGSTFSGARGEFAIEHLPPGTYIAEIVDASGNLIGMSAPFVLGGSPTVTVSVVSVANGSITGGHGARFSLHGLGPVSSLAVVGAAGAAAVTAVVATRQDASPSR